MIKIGSFLTELFKKRDRFLGHSVVRVTQSRAISSGDLGL